MFLPFIVFAHEGGFAYEAQIGDYFVDIGYTPDLTAGEPVRFDFAIAKEKDGQPIVFNNAWVRITGEKLLFAGPISYGEFGRPGFTYVFPEEGSYEISVRFESGKGELAEAKFSIDILKADAGLDTRLFIEIGLVIFLLAVLPPATIYVVKRK